MYNDLNKKPRVLPFLRGYSWFKTNNLGLVLAMALKFNTILAKGLKPKVRKFFGLLPLFVEVTGEKLVRAA